MGLPIERRIGRRHLEAGVVAQCDAGLSIHRFFMTSICDFSLKRSRVPFKVAPRKIRHEAQREIAEAVGHSRASILTAYAGSGRSIDPAGKT